MVKNNRNPEKKTQKHVKEEKKKAIKRAAKQELIDLKQHLTSSEKSQINPLFPIAPTRCNQCGDGFGSVKAAREHRKRYGYKFECGRSSSDKPSCGCIFTRKDELKIHKTYHLKGVTIDEEGAEGSDEEEEESEEEEEGAEGSDEEEEEAEEEENGEEM